MNRHLRQLCGALMAAPTTALAMAPDYGIGEAIVIGLLIAVALVWLLSVWIVAKLGGALWSRPGSAWRVGLAYAIVTILAAGIWTVRFASNAEREHAETAAQWKVAGQAHSRACLQRAGEEILATATQPAVVYVHVDSTQADYLSGLGWPPDQGSGGDRVLYVSRFPAERPEGAVFVEARSVVEPTPGAQGFPLLATSVEVRSADQKLLARRFDVIRNDASCLGPDRQPTAVRRFVERVVGLDIAYASGAIHREGVATVPAAGSLGPIEESRFEPSVTEPSSPAFSYPGLTSLLQANGCAMPAAPSDDVVCAGTTAWSNSTRRSALLAGIEVEGGWLAISRAYAGDEFVDMLDAVKRDRRGAIVARWRIRIPPIDRPVVVVEAARLDGTHLTVDFALDPEFTSLPGVDGQSRTKATYRHRIRMQVELPPDSDTAKSGPATSAPG